MNKNNNMENKQLATYKYYNLKGERLSIFGRELEGKLEVVIISCSKSDVFKKSIGRDYYQAFIDKKEIVLKIQEDKTTKYYIPIVEKYNISIEEGNTPAFQFDLFCKKTFRKMQDFQLTLVGKGFITGKIEIKQTMKGISITTKVLEYAK